MFFIAASNSADGVSWFDAVDFFCVFAKPTDALAKRKTAGSSHGALKEGLFFIKKRLQLVALGARSLERARSKVRNFEGALSIACIVVIRYSKPAAASRFLLRGKRAVTFVEIERRADA